MIKGLIKGMIKASNKKDGGLVIHIISGLIRMTRWYFDDFIYLSLFI